MHRSPPTRNKLTSLAARHYPVSSDAARQFRSTNDERFFVVNTRAAVPHIRYFLAPFVFSWVF